MKSLFDPGARDELVGRLASLTADARPKWGRFTPAKMVAHLNAWSVMATGELPIHTKGPWLLRTAPFRWLGIYVLPWPKGSPTAPELLAGNDAAEFEAERARFAAGLDQVIARAGRGAWVGHPAFGDMTERDWGVLGYRHADHHFTQFGV